MDGGYYLIGFGRENFPAGVFEGMPWSSSSVLNLTMKYLEKKGIKTVSLKEMRDIDTAEDLEIALRGGDMPFTRAYVRSEIRFREEKCLNTISM
jgi:glycosyltransferase A (GT-A) superfamily protein (DUF2064 family)